MKAYLSEHDHHLCSSAAEFQQFRWNYQEKKTYINLSLLKKDFLFLLLLTLHVTHAQKQTTTQKSLKQQAILYYWSGYFDVRNHSDNITWKIKVFSGPTSFHYSTRCSAALHANCYNGKTKKLLSSASFCWALSRTPTLPLLLTSTSTTKQTKKLGR